MKSINILSLIQGYESLSDDDFKAFKSHYGIQIKNAELQDLKKLLECLCNEDDNPCLFSGFYVGYKIPQIGKEFDLLKIGSNAVINIELKRTSSPEKIRNQLQRNRYYLSFIGKAVFTFSYVSDTQSLYYLDKNSNLTETDIKCVIDALIKNSDSLNTNIDNLFNPSDYLVSPFNSTDKFINNLYFLTHQQEEFKDNILKIISTSLNANFISVTGAAGTGKTLLVYDVVKRILSEGHKVLVVHCGNLNAGHHRLKELGWNIIGIKMLLSTDLTHFDTILVDEAQRIKADQLINLISSVKSNKTTCIFSYDKLQTLGRGEEYSGVNEVIVKSCDTCIFNLSEKIRSNKEIASFIKMLFNKNTSLDQVSSGNIVINYFNNLDDARSYLYNLDHHEWEVLRFTPSQYDNEHHEDYSYFTHKKSHEIIGQEFDNVAVTIDKHFKYNGNGKLIYSGYTYYNPIKMFFQNITRTRKRLNLIIISNEEILKRCLSIIK
ncbi:DNA/RNA helicase domain-containing protein [Pantoea agglomerans]|uniref:DNA/RNA helicase domain-containing protein n=1 Tax=Enterobacter agglomerans TaxID=549 RepID=UPI0010095F05|nr:DNA/RNA helicase domain-containing protein [Pantoea agglomerans]QAV47634.1 DUF2075 domain-containing protein [Pantoea agglomerans]QAV52162.1 DUF2075 domain-containing protein [Pantoea agglomerans]